MEVKQLEQMYDVAIHQTEQVERDIEQSATEKKLAFRQAKTQLFQQIEDFEKIYDKNIDINKEERTKKVCHIKGKLRVKQTSVKATREEVVSAVQSGSEYQVVSQYPEISTKLRHLVESQPNATDTELSRVKFKPTNETRAKALYIEQSIHLICKKFLVADRTDDVKVSNKTTSSVRTTIESVSQSEKQDNRDDSFGDVKQLESTLAETCFCEVTAETLPCSQEAPASTESESNSRKFSDTAKCLKEAQGLEIQLPKDKELSQSKDEKSLPAMLLWPRIKWRKCGRIRTDLKAKFPHAVAVQPNRDMAVTSSWRGGPVAIFSRRGAFQHFVKGGSPCGAHDIAITLSNQYIVPGKKEFHICDSHTVIKSIPTYDINNQPSKPDSVAVDSKGRIIVGLNQDNHKTVSIHKPDGTTLSRFETSSPPRKLTCASDDNLIISFQDNSLQLIGQSGHNARFIQPPTGIEIWEPWYVSCSKQGELFVGNWGNPKGVFRYLLTDGEFKYIDCVATMEWYPFGLALSADADEVFVVDHWGHAVHIFR